MSVMCGRPTTSTRSAPRETGHRALQRPEYRRVKRSGTVLRTFKAPGHSRHPTRCAPGAARRPPSRLERQDRVHRLPRPRAVTLAIENRIETIVKSAALYVYTRAQSTVLRPTSSSSARSPTTRPSRAAPPPTAPPARGAPPAPAPPPSRKRRPSRRRGGRATTSRARAARSSSSPCTRAAASCASRGCRRRWPRARPRPFHSERRRRRRHLRLLALGQLALRRRDVFSCASTSPSSTT